MEKIVSIASNFILVKDMSNLLDFNLINQAFDKLKFTDQRGICQTLLRNKKVLFYMDKTPKDFTNSKNFWNFYQALCINQKMIQVM